MALAAHSRPLYSSRVMALALVSTLAFAPAVFGAQPIPDSCDQQDSGERLRCRFGNIISQQQASADSIASMPTVPENQKQALMKQVERNGHARGRTTAEEFKQLTKKSKTSCQILEIAGDSRGDDDGICTGNEECVEVVGDQIGDDDGICRPRNGRNRETCVEICDQEAINSDPGNFDDDPAQDSLARDIEQELDGITNQYVALNGMLAQEAQIRSAAGVLAGSGDPCATVIAARANTNTFAFLVGLADGTRIGADIAERFCDQTAFGVNTAAVCSVIEGIAGAAKVTATIFQFGDSSVDSNTIDASFACLKSLNTGVGTLSTDLGALSADVGRVSSDLGSLSTDVRGIGSAVGDSNSELAVIQTRIDGLEARLDGLRQMVVEVQGQVGEVKVLLNTPSGRREDFPSGSTGTTP